MQFVKCMKFLKNVGSTSSLHNHVKSICLSAERSKEMLEEVSSLIWKLTSVKVHLIMQICIDRLA